MIYRQTARIGTCLPCRLHPAMAIDPAYYSTREAADRLGVSLATIQNMVERGELPAWKTQGGHRRIPREAVEAKLASTTPQEKRSKVFQILIVEDDPALKMLYERQVQSWNMPIELRMVSNGLEGLLEIGRQPPDLLLTDLIMPELDGFAMLNALRTSPRVKPMAIVAVSGLEDEVIASRGGLPAGVTRMHKPVPFHELHGYVQALHALFVREQAASHPLVR